MILIQHNSSEYHEGHGSLHVSITSLPFGLWRFWTEATARVKSTKSIRHWNHNYSPSTSNYIKCAGRYLTNCWFFWPQFILSCFIFIFCLVSFCWFIYKYLTDGALSKMSGVLGAADGFTCGSVITTRRQRRGRTVMPAYECNEEGSGAHTSLPSVTEGKYIHLSDWGCLSRSLKGALRRWVLHMCVRYFYWWAQWRLFKLGRITRISSTSTDGFSLFKGLFIFI